MVSKKRKSTNKLFNISSEANYKFENLELHRIRELNEKELHQNANRCETLENCLRSQCEYI